MTSAEMSKEEMELKEKERSLAKNLNSIKDRMICDSTNYKRAAQKLNEVRAKLKMEPVVDNARVIFDKVTDQ